MDFLATRVIKLLGRLIETESVCFTGKKRLMAFDDETAILCRPMMFYEVMGTHMRSVEIRRKNIGVVLNVALALFNEYGVENVTMELIAKRAHLAPRSVYRYFKTRLALLEAAAKRLFQNICEVAGTVSGTVEFASADGMQQIEMILRRYADVVLADQSTAITLIALEAALTRAASNPLPTFYYSEQNGIVQQMRRSIAKGRNDGSILNTEYNDSSIYNLFVFYQGLLNHTINAYTGPRHTESSVSLDILNNGINRMQYWLLNNLEAGNQALFNELAM